MTITVSSPGTGIVADSLHHYAAALNRETQGRSRLLTAAGSERAAWAAIERADARAVKRLRDYGKKILKPSVPLLLELQQLGRRMLFDWSREAGEALVEQYTAPGSYMREATQLWKWWVGVSITGENTPPL